MLGAEIGVMREAGLQLVDRLGGDPGREDLVQPHEGVMIALEPGDARLDRKPGRAASAIVARPASVGRSR